MEIKLRDIIEKLGYLKFIGNDQAVIKNVISLGAGKVTETDILWISDKNLSALDSIDCGSIIIPAIADTANLKPTCNYIIVENPRSAFSNLIRSFFYQPFQPKIEKTASIDPSAKIGNGNYIGNNVVIEKDVVIGDNNFIGHNTVLLARTVIGNNVVIGNNNTIGGVGFGYERNTEGKYELIPHIGNVVIEDNVEIGNNTCIDRAVLGSTLLTKNVKVDNLVHIAHGVSIGNNSLIIANSMIAGSTVIGENVWVAPSAAVINQITIGDNVVIGMGAMVLKPVDAGLTVVGNPAKPLQKKV